MNKKGQQLTLMVLFSIFIFFLVVTLFYDELLFNPRIAERTHQLLEREAQRASETLIGTGYPENWDLDNVQRIGLMTNQSLDEEKIHYLETLIDQEYAETKTYLGIRHDYIIKIITTDETFFFSNPEPQLINEEELLATNPHYLATHTRTVPYLDDIATITIHIYRYVI